MNTAIDIETTKQRAALVSVAVKLALTVGKFVAAALSGSLALVSEAGNNLGDVAVTLLSFYSIRIAAKPADEEHQYGHGKVEAVSALIQTGFLFALAAFILIEAVKRLVHGGTDVQPDLFSYAVLVVSIVVDAARWSSLNRIAKATGSHALAADALNFATDIVASAMALAGLVAAHFGFTLGDTLAAVGVSLFVGIAGFRLGASTVAALIDTAPKGASQSVRALVSKIPGVMDIVDLRLRPIGTTIGGDVTISVSRALTLERVEKIKLRIADALGKSYPGAHLAVTAEPVALDNETVVERVLFIANRRHVPIHHVTVQALADGRRSVSFDAEVDGRMSLGDAHELVTALESAIGEELGEGFEVESHIEPMEISELSGRDSSAATRDDVFACFQRHLSDDDALRDVHDVRVRETPAGLVVNYHCLVDASLSVDAAHRSVDAFERRVRIDCPDIARIVGHAEPRRT